MKKTRSDRELIPKRLQTPELMNALATAARASGIDPTALRIGSGRNSINPHTGQPEFADDTLAPQQGPIENVTVTGQRPFSLNDVNNAARLIYAEAGNQP